MFGGFKTSLFGQISERPLPQIIPCVLGNVIFCFHYVANRCAQSRRISTVRSREATGDESPAGRHIARHGSSLVSELRFSRKFFSLFRRFLYTSRNAKDAVRPTRNFARDDSGRRNERDTRVGFLMSVFDVNFEWKFQ